MDKLGPLDALKRLQEAEIKSLNQDEIDHLVHCLFFTGFLQKGPSPVIGHKFYRGMHLPDKGFVPKHRDDLGAPPPSKTKLNRANRPGESVLYCGTHPSVPMWELSAKKGDRLLTTTWRVQQPIVCVGIGYSKSVLARLHPKFELPPWSLESDEGGEMQKKINEFLCALFTIDDSMHPVDAYSVSSAVARKYLVGDTVEAIAYPSIKSKIPANNLAIKSTAIHSKVVLDSADLVEVTECSSERIDVYIYANLLGFNEDNTCNWRFDDSYRASLSFP